MSQAIMLRVGGRSAPSTTPGRASDFRTPRRRRRRGAVVAVGEGNGASGRGWRGQQRTPTPSTPPGRALDFRLPGTDAVLWSPSGKATVLQDAGGQGDSYAYAINDAGWSVGFSNTASGGAGRGAVVAVREGDGASGRGRPGHQRRLRHQRRRAERRIFRYRERRRTRCCGRRRGRRPCFGTWAAMATAGPRHQRRRAERWILRYAAAATTRCCGHRRGRRRTSATFSGRGRHQRLGDQQFGRHYRRGRIPWQLASSTC